MTKSLHRLTSLTWIGLSLTATVGLAQDWDDNLLGPTDNAKIQAAAEGHACHAVITKRKLKIQAVRTYTLSYSCTVQYVDPIDPGYVDLKAPGSPYVQRVQKETYNSPDECKARKAFYEKSGMQGVKWQGKTVRRPYAFKKAKPGAESDPAFVESEAVKVCGAQLVESVKALGQDSHSVLFIQDLTENAGLSLSLYLNEQEDTATQHLLFQPGVRVGKDVEIYGAFRKSRAACPAVALRDLQDRLDAAALVYRLAKGGVEDQIRDKGYKAVCEPAPTVEPAPAPAPIVKPAPAVVPAPVLSGSDQGSQDAGVDAGSQ